MFLIWMTSYPFVSINIYKHFNIVKVVELALEDLSQTYYQDISKTFKELIKKIGPIFPVSLVK
jgi:HD superfamily phosphohydrolase YqeK